jgi:molybdenum cofactor cytidylyltransferase
MRLAALVLAAGKAQRFGGDKLSAPLAGEPLLFHAIRAARAAPVERVVVSARGGLDCGIWQGDPAVDVVRIESEALSDSLRAGLEALHDPDGVFVFLADMPLIPHGVAAVLAENLGSNFAVQPCFNGKPGHPVLFAGRAVPELQRLRGHQGAGGILRGRADILRMDCNDPGVVRDVDRPADLAAMSAQSERRTGD